MKKAKKKKAYRREIENTRNDLLYETKKSNKSDDTTRIIVKYSNQHTKI